MLMSIVPEELHPTVGESWSWCDRVWMIHAALISGLAALAAVIFATWLLILSQSPFTDTGYLFLMALAWMMMCASSVILVPMAVISVMSWLYCRHAEKRCFRKLAKSVEGVDARRVAGWQDGYFPVILEWYCKEREQEQAKEN